MARPSQLVEDRTALDGERLDVGARIGWLLRATREWAGLPLRAMPPLLAGQGVEIAYSSLSRVERGHWRRGDVIDAYESVTGLEPGRLRAVVDVLCRTFPYGPGDDEPTSKPTLAAYDAAVRAVRGAEPTGSDWLRFARTQDPDQGFGMPSDDLHPLVRRLTSELARGVGTAFVTRYEALSRLRCGTYGHLVAEVAMGYLTEPGVQLVADVASAVSERASASLVGWAAAQLDHPADISMSAAATVLENMANSGRLPAADWRSVPPGYATAYTHAREAGDDARRLRLDRLYSTLPRSARDAIRRRVEPPPTPVRTPVSWAGIRSNSHFTSAVELSDHVTGGHDEPMLTRLLFEMLYDFRPARSFNAALLVAASPYPGAVTDALVETATSHDDELTRDGAVTALCQGLRAESRPRVRPWLRDADPGLRITALVAAGMTGLELPARDLRPEPEHPELHRWLVWYAGMSAPRLLARWQNAGLITPEAAPAAGWWRRHGTRVTQ